MGNCCSRQAKENKDGESNENVQRGRSRARQASSRSRHRPTMFDDGASWSPEPQRENTTVGDNLIPNQPFARNNHLVSKPSVRLVKRPTDAKLKRHIWTFEGPNLPSRLELDQQRIQFWDTRTGNDENVWTTLNHAIQELLLVDSSESGLNACEELIRLVPGITITTGDLCGGVVDRAGHHYDLPDWVHANPTNMRPTMVARPTSIEQVVGPGVCLNVD